MYFAIVVSLPLSEFNLNILSFCCLNYKTLYIPYFIDISYISYEDLIESQLNLGSNCTHLLIFSLYILFSNESSFHLKFEVPFKFLSLVPIYLFFMIS